MEPEGTVQYITAFPSQPLFPIMTQINTIRIVPTVLIKINFNITFPS